MRSFTFDIETNGLLDSLTHIKCLNVIDNTTLEEYRFTDHEVYLDAVTGLPTGKTTPRAGTIAEGIALLAGADELCGHNIIGFDLPAIRLCMPEGIVELNPKKLFDTQVVSRLVYTDIEDRDRVATLKGKLDLPATYKKRRHSLGAWGCRLGGTQKGDFTPSAFNPKWTWNDYPFSQECDDYCMDDVRVNAELVKHMKRRLEEMEWPMESVQLEQDVQTILVRQMQHGWKYDVDAAHKLVAELQKEKLDLEERLHETFKPFYKKDGKTFTPKRDNAKMGYTADAPMSKVKLTDFNPGSRDHIADRLIKQFGWEPEEFTPAGKPKVDETVLGKLDFPEAKLCAEYFTVGKMLGQVADGAQAQLNNVDPDGRIRGYVNHNGAVTGRMTHSKPNIAQTDKDPRVRGLYITEDGYVLVGCDADSLELRCLAHRLALFDKGAYVKVILTGNKADGTDMHTRNQKAVGLNDRDSAKTIFYAWAYGAGDYKLGTVVYNDWPEEKRERFNARFQGEARKRKLVTIGAKARARLVAGIDGMEKLIKKVKGKVNNPGYLKGLDGRRVILRSQHAALNTLLQGDGALVMKKALVLLDRELRKTLVPGVDYEFVGNIHDEWQIESKECHAEFIGKTASQSIADAGEDLGFRCPLAGDYDVGRNWSETH